MLSYVVVGFCFLLCFLYILFYVLFEIYKKELYRKLYRFFYWFGLAIEVPLFIIGSLHLKGIL